jgi:endonuclease/exonuclease/phosphatase family metal-dependent hydrolase
VSHKLGIASFNAENFSLLLDGEYDLAELNALDEETYRGMNTSIYNPNKPREKIAAVAETILEHDFDLVGLCEVGGMETLQNFNRIYLGSRYECALHEENSSRGIYVGALLKAGRFPSHRATSMGGDFSRNLLKLDLGEEGGGLEVFVLHLKSQRGDDYGLEKRIEEIDRLSSIVRRKKCIVMGDFNGVLIRGMHQFEYERFLELPMYDVLAATGIPQHQRRTHYYFGAGARHSQLDYIFCTHDIEVLDAGVIEDTIPRNRAERNRLPSDHLFIHAVIEVE